jgi:phosphoglucomutase
MIKRYNQFVKQVNENIDEIPLDKTETETEEEGVDVFQKNLQELADLLDTDVIDGKVIYNGEEIIFPSETESFHVGKKKFKTAKEVKDYLTK